MEERRGTGGAACSRKRAQGNSGRADDCLRNSGHNRPDHRHPRGCDGKRRHLDPRPGGRIGNTGSARGRSGNRRARECENHRQSHHDRGQGRGRSHRTGADRSTWIGSRTRKPHGSTSGHRGRHHLRWPRRHEHEGCRCRDRPHGRDRRSCGRREGRVAGPVGHEARPDFFRLRRSVPPVETLISELGLSDAGQERVQRGWTGPEPRWATRCPGSSGSGNVPRATPRPRSTWARRKHPWSGSHRDSRRSSRR